MKSIIYVLTFIILASIALAWDPMPCGNFTEDFTINQSITIQTPCQINLSDANTNGAIKINGDNIILDGAGTVLKGDAVASSRGIYGIKRVNITIKNFEILNYSTGAYIDGMNFSSISNINIHDSVSATTGIRLASWASFSNNVTNISCTSVFSTCVSALTPTDSIFDTITTTSATQRMIETLNTGLRTTVKNSILLSGDTGIEADCEYCSFIGNVINSTDYGIYVYSTPLAYNTTITNNIINSSDIGIYLSGNMVNMSIGNNTVENSVTAGIKCLGGNYSISNNTMRNMINGILLNDNVGLVSGNSITNATSPINCNAGCDSTLLINNIIGDPFTSILFKTVNGANMSGTTFTGGIGKYRYNGTNLNIALNETSASYHMFNIMNSTLLLNYSGIKDISYNNETIIINTLPGRSFDGLRLRNGSAVVGYLTQASLPYSFNIGTLTTNNQWVLDNTSCVVPFEDYTVNATSSLITLCPQTYQGADIGNDGYIKINANFVNFSCGGARLQGNDSRQTSRGITLNSKNGVTISDCIIDSYGQDIRISAPSNSNFVRNSILSNSSNTVLYIDGQNNTISNNTFDSNKTTIDIYRKGNVIAGNYFFSTYPVGSIYNVIFEGTADLGTFANNSMVANTKGLQILTNNTIVKGNTLTGGARINLGPAQNILIQNNTLRGSSLYAISPAARCNNITIDQNNLLDGDIGIRASKSDNILITNNYIHNMTTNDDGYNVGVHLWQNATNVTLLNNIISWYGHSGVVVQNTTNLKVDNLTCNQTTISSKIHSGIAATDSGGWIDFYEPTACINIVEIYKGYTGDGTEARGDNLTNKFAPLRSDTIAISNITYDYYVQTVLRLQGTTNVVTDFNLSNMWIASFQGPTSLTDMDFFYNSNERDRLSNYPYNGSGEQYVFHKNYYTNSRGTDNFINYTISKTSLTFKNANSTNNYGLIVYNLSSPNNDILNVSNGVLLAQNQSSYTTTLTPSQQVNVGDYTTSTISAIPTYSVTSGATLGTYYVDLLTYLTGNTSVSATFSVSSSSTDIYCGLSGRSLLYIYNPSGLSSSATCTVAASDSHTTTPFTMTFAAPTSPGGASLGPGAPTPPPVDNTTLFVVTNPPAVHNSTLFTRLLELLNLNSTQSVSTPSDTPTAPAQPSSSTTVIVIVIAAALIIWLTGIYKLVLK